MKKANRTTPFKIVMYIILGIIGSVALAIALFIGLYSWHGSTDDITRVADQLKIPPNWTLESERIKPPKIICIDDTPCPSLQRDWLVPNIISKKYFEELVNSTGWGLIVNGSCVLSGKISGYGISTCTASGRVAEYIIDLDLAQDSFPPYRQKLSLEIRPK